MRNEGMLSLEARRIKLWKCMFAENDKGQFSIADAKLVKYSLVLESPRH